MAEATREFAIAKTMEILRAYVRKIETARGYFDCLSPEGCGIVENYDNNVDGQKTLLLKACGRLFGDAVAKIGVNGLFFVLSLFGLKKASIRHTTRTISESKPVSGKWTWKSFKENVLKIGEAGKTSSSNETPQILLKQNHNNGRQNLIWNNITKTADNIPNTEIPTTFTLKLNTDINYINPKTNTRVLWTNANATEHMGEYILRFGVKSDSIKIKSQIMLESYSAALNEAMHSLVPKPPGRYFGIYGNWELGINTENGLVYHARMID